MKRLFFSLFWPILVTLLILSGCGGGGGGGDDTPSDPANLGLSATSISKSVTTGSTPLPESINMVNIDLDNTHTYSIDTDQNWLAVTSSTSGSLDSYESTKITVDIKSASLTPDTYAGNLTVTDGTGDTVTLPVQLTVSDTGDGGGETATTSSIVVAGNASSTQLSSLAANTQAFDTDARIPNAKVTIVVVRPDQTKTETTTTTDDLGNYSINVTASPDDTILINIVKDGYTKFSKKITSDNITDGSTFTVNGNMAQAQIITVIPEETLTASGTSQRSFKFGLYKSVSGDVQVAAAGDSIASATGTEPVLEINLPTERMNDNVQSVTAQLAVFDSNDPNDRKMFPGDFVGIGGNPTGASVASTNSYQLESVTFMQAEIQQDDGRPLELQESDGVSTAAAGDWVIVKAIPSTGCSQLLKYSDWDESILGLQVPIYTYSPYEGTWGYLGTGTLLTYNSAAADYDLASGFLADISCSDTTYYFGLSDTSVSEWYTWWNLDYPLIFSTPTIHTLTGTVTDSQGNPASGAFVEAFSDSYFYTYADESGKYRLEVVKEVESIYNATFENFSWTNGSLTVQAYNQFTYQYQDPDLGIISITSPNGEVLYNNVDFVLSNPYTCSVEGTVQKDASPLTYEMVYAWSSTTGYWNYTTTNDRGKFKMNAPCADDVELYTAGFYKQFNVDSLAGGDEAIDTGDVVVLDRIAVTNRAPEAWLDAFPYEVFAGDPIELYGWGYDPDGTAITYQWRILDADGVDQNESLGTDYYALFDTTGYSNGTYTAELKITDEDQKFSVVTINVTIFEDNANNPPELFEVGITTAGVDPCTPDTFAWTSTFDADGDPLTTTWEISEDNNGVLDQLTTVSLDASESPDNPGFFLVDLSSYNSAEMWLTAAVSDGVDTTTMSTLTTVPTDPTPAILGVGLSPFDPINGEDVSLFANAWISNFTDLTFAWDVVDSFNSTLVDDYTSNPAYVFDMWNLGTGTYFYNVAVTGCGATVSYNSSFTVAASSSDTTGAPQIIEVGVDASTPEILFLSVFAWDPDDDPLTYSWSYIDPATETEVLIDGSGTPEFDDFLEWAPPTELYDLTIDIVVTVDDGTSFVTQTQPVTMPSRSNTAPTVTSISAIAGTEDITLSATATDGEGDTLTYSWSFVHPLTGSEATIGTGSDLIWVPQSDLAGLTITVAVTVSDGFATGTDSTTVTVPETLDTSTTNGNVLIQ